jgi:hypothetical protein
MKLSEINHLAEKQKQDPVNDKELDKLEWLLVGCLAICAVCLWVAK